MMLNVSGGLSLKVGLFGSRFNSAVEEISDSPQASAWGSACVSNC